VAVAVFFTAGLTTGFALATDFAGCFAVLIAPDFLAGAFALTGFADFTALFAGAFFAAGLAAALRTGFSDPVSALTVFFAKVFAGTLAAAFLAAGLAREVAALDAIFFVLLTDFVTVAFMVPLSLNELAPLRSDRALRAIYRSRIIQARYPLSSKLG
jgi:hypothetical protein